MTIEDLLIKHEADRSKPYLDCCGKPWRQCTCPVKGKLTIGIGRNLDDVGLSPSESRYLCENDLGRIRTSFDHVLPWWRDLDPVRQMVLLDMGFNLGVAGLLQFRMFLAALREGRYGLAADHMLDSDWASQVGKRALELADMMRTARIEV